MTIGARFTKLLGLQQVNNSTGFSVEKDTGNAGFGPFKVDTMTDFTASVTLGAGNAGVNTISGSGAVVLTMPTAASCPGATFIFRSKSASAHALTGALETAGTMVFYSPLSSSVGVTSLGGGSKLTFGAFVGNSVSMVSDGVKFLVTSYSGTLLVNGT